MAAPLDDEDEISSSSEAVDEAASAAEDEDDDALDPNSDRVATEEDELVAALAPMDEDETKVELLFAALELEAMTEDDAVLLEVELKRDAVLVEVELKRDAVVLEERVVLPM